MELELEQDILRGALVDWVSGMAICIGGAFIIATLI